MKNKFHTWKWLRVGNSTPIGAAFRVTRVQKCVKRKIRENLERVVYTFSWAFRKIIMLVRELTERTGG